MQKFLDEGTDWRKSQDYHTPLYYLPVSEKEGYDWFTVVRNPFTRVISEYAWCHRNIFQDSSQTDETYANKFLVKWITNLNSPFKQPMNNLPFILHDKGKDHFLEQYKYIDYKYPIRVLRFEALEEDFNALMKDYDNEFTLDLKVNDIPDKPIDIINLYPETISLIQQVYARDFTTFGYSTDPANASVVPPPITLTFVENIA